MDVLSLFAKKLISLALFQATTANILSYLSNFSPFLVIIVYLCVFLFKD